MSSFARTRSRVPVLVSTPIGQQSILNYGGYNDQEYTAKYNFISPRETTVDEIHTQYPYEGGPFLSRKCHATFTNSPGWVGRRYVDPNSGKDVKNMYSGRFIAIPPYPYNTLRGFNTLPPDVTSLAQAQGPACWNRFKPAKPRVSLSIALVELKDAPQLLFKKLNSFRSLGNNYLALEFGWKPFLSDIRRWFASISKIDAQIAYLRNNNGKRIRRGGTLLETKNQIAGPTTTYSAMHKYSVTPWFDFCMSTNNMSKTTETVEDIKCWFKGSFRYYIPGLESQKWGKYRAIRQLWDLELGPEQVYNLIPFSWLVDWFSNLGDVVSNLASSMEDNLVADYAYVMYSKTKQIRTTYSWSAWQQTESGGPIKWAPHTAGNIIETSAKSRVAASPFGFNWEFPDFTAWQLSILSALGISRLKF
jgi:hypothetical protein